MPFFAKSQISNKRCKWVVYSQEEFDIDSLSIFPSSLSVSYPRDTSVKIIYDINNGKAKIVSANPLDSVQICYSVLPYQLNRLRYKRNFTDYDSTKTYREDYAVRRTAMPDKREELFSSPGISKTGNISRGISFGNNQNVFVNSALNLQLDGKLTEDITLTAVVSDQNIPFQPDGNTQQLQQFDRVYVQLKSKKVSVIAGDVVMRNKPSNFLRYYRNVQGGQLEVNSGDDSTNRSSTSFGVAVAKGKFNSILFTTGQPDTLVEGVQGPYRLRGANNERFIVVLANSEKIYLDGRLLKRGWDFDYTINYNQAEITFTNNVLITRYSRVRVDFEYSDRNYSRVIINASHYQDYKKVHVFGNYYQEKDNPDNPITPLSQQTIQTLSTIGDSINQALISGVDTVAFSANMVLYRAVTINGIITYQYSTNADSAIYNVQFTQVIPGSYTASVNTVNGRIYNYVGYPNGTYEPLQVIATPKLRQMITAGGSVDVSKSEKISGEVALSQYSQNLFSNRDNANHGGYSYKVGYANMGKKIGFLNNDYKFVGGIDYEFNSRNFFAVDRFRGPDFERNWSENTNIVADNNLFNVTAGVVKNESNKISYQLTSREKVTDVNGTQHYITLNKSLGNFQLLSNAFLMNSNNSAGIASWRKYSVNSSYKTRYFVPGFVYSSEKNLVQDALGNVLKTAMYYDETKGYIRNNDTLNYKFFVDYAYRKDKEAYAGSLADNSEAQTSDIGFSGKISKSHTVNTSVTYRYLKSDIGPTPLPNEETVMGKGEWNADFFKKHIRSELLVTGASGRELKKQFIYISVAPGLGNYVWVDYNHDGKQDLNEFVEKVYDDPNGEFIRSYVPTDQYITAYTNSFNYRFDATAPRSWRTSERAAKRFFSKFSNVSSVISTKKITDNSLLKRFIPFSSNIDEQNIISLQNALRTTLFFNRSSPKYGFDFVYNNTESKQFLTQGFETRIANEMTLNSRLNAKKIFNIKYSTSKTIKSSLSDFLDAKNYRIQAFKFTPSISIQPRNTFRFTFNAAYTLKSNIMKSADRENAKLLELGIEAKVNKLSHRSITGSFKYIKIDANLQGTDPSSPLAYEMFEALQPGLNFTWNVAWQEKLTNGLQLSFNYEGRKSENSGVIHIGRMQVSALF